MVCRDGAVARQPLSTIADKGGAGDIRGSAGTKEEREVGQLVFCPVTSQWNVLFHPLANLFRGRQSAHALCVIGRTGRDAVRANSQRSPFNSEGLKKQLDASFGRAYVGLVSGGNSGV